MCTDKNMPPTHDTAPMDHGFYKGKHVRTSKRPNDMCVCVSKVGSLGDRKNKTNKKIGPATLLTKALAEPRSHNRRSFWVEFAHFVAAVVVFGVAQIGVASLRLAPWSSSSAQRVPHSQQLAGSRPPVQPAHEIVVSGREVSASSQVQAYPVWRAEIERPRDVHLRLGYEEVVRRSGSCWSTLVEREQGWSRRVSMVDGIGWAGGVRIRVVEGVMKLVCWDIMSGLMTIYDGQMLLVRKQRWRKVVVRGLMMIGLGRVENGQGSGCVKVLVMVSFFSGSHYGGGVVPFVVQHFLEEIPRKMFFSFFFVILLKNKVKERRMRG